MIYISIRRFIRVRGTWQ